MPRGAVPLLLLLATLSLSAPLAFAQADDYFPLQVGQWWLYQSLPRVWCEGCDLYVERVCTEAGRNATYDLRVADTVRVDLGWATEPRWLDATSLPPAPEGLLCYELTGSLARQLGRTFRVVAFLSVLPVSVLVVQGSQAEFAAWLTTVPDDYEIEWPAEGDGLATWLIGVRQGEELFLFGRRLLMWYLPSRVTPSPESPDTPSRYAHSYIEGEGDPVGAAFRLAGVVRGAFEVAGNTYASVAAIVINGAGYIEPYTALLAPGVGIVALSDERYWQTRACELVASGVDSSPAVPTTTAPITWGTLKKGTKE